jgi:predicted MFS family arabinose efflux permease
VLPVVAVAAVLGLLNAFSVLSVPWWGWLILLALALAGMSRFMWFLIIFTGYWIVFWQQYISLPGYLQHYVDANAPVEKILVTDGATVIALTIAVSFLTRKIPPLAAVILGTIITSVAWLILAFHPSILGAVLSIFVMALGEITQQPPYYDYISRLAPPGQQGTYMGFAFLPIGIGSLIGGPLGGWMLHHFGEEQHQPAKLWFMVTGIGLATALALWIYDRMFIPRETASS